MAFLDPGTNQRIGRCTDDMVKVDYTPLFMVGHITKEGPRGTQGPGAHGGCRAAV